jgi:2-C-methyl-D-erythritol 4-phosphate cytidylyltransferase
VAGGLGVRMGADVPKALMPVGGRPLVAWCVDALIASGLCAPVVIAAPAGHERAIAEAAGADGDDVRVVTGGATRAESVARGLAALPDGPGRVLVHDAARPLLTPALVAAVLDGIGDADGAIAAAPLADTPKRVDAALQITGTPDRAELWLAQTPQAFTRDALEAAVRAAEREGRLGRATDCASLVEAVGGRVRVVQSRHPNLKVTTPADVLVAEALLAAAGARPVR